MHHIYLYGLVFSCKELKKKKIITKTINLESINYLRHPTNIQDLLSIKENPYVFNFQTALNMNAINNETKCLDRKAHLFWEIPIIDAKVNELMDALSYSGDAAPRLVIVKTQELSSRSKKEKKKIISNQNWVLSTT